MYNILKKKKKTFGLLVWLSYTYFYIIIIKYHLTFQSFNKYIFIIFKYSLYMNMFVYKLFIYIICFSGRGERYHNIPGNNVERATYMTDADTNSLDLVDSDTSLYFEDSIQHDAGSPFKVLAFNINAIMYCYISCKVLYVMYFMYFVVTV